MSPELIGIIIGFLGILLMIWQLNYQMNQRFDALRSEIKDLESTLRGEMKDLESALHGEIKDLESALHGEIKDLESALRGEINSLRAEIKTDMNTLLLGFFSHSRVEFPEQKKQAG